MTDTVKTQLNQGQLHTLPDNLRRLHKTDGTYGFGDMLDALRPRGPRLRDSLTSGTEHVHDVAAWIIDVYITAGTPLAKIYGAASPGAGEVHIAYNTTTGVPTFTFAGATTEYSVVEMGPLPTTIAAVMTTSVGA